MSATYRQAARATPEKLERDPDNRLLSRGPRFRMDAEMVRDYALAASGLLAPKIGGPSVKPYQPDGVWEAVAMIGSNTRNYQPDSGETCTAAACTRSGSGARRRRRWTFSTPPRREFCTVSRERTNTPLQALVTLNDPQFIEAARTWPAGAQGGRPTDAAGPITSPCGCSPGRCATTSGPIVESTWPTC
jgi:hypothetical protein